MKPFFKAIEDVPPSYVEAEMSNLLDQQIGKENLDVLGVTETEIGTAELSGMQGAGCILHFATSRDDCNAIGIVLFCDYYQVAAGKASRENGNTVFELKRLYADTDCFSLNEVLGSIRGIELPNTYEPRCEVSNEGIFFSGKLVRK